MAHSRGEKCSRGGWTNDELQKVWDKGYIISGRDPDKYRKDVCGAIIYWDSYGLESDLGWEVDHKNPCANGGTDNIVNLQPLHWKNNDAKGDNYPNWSCAVVASQ